MTPRRYPDKLEIVPLTKPPNATIRVPGSKSITNRALVLAALASQQGSCNLVNALECDDTAVMIDSLRRLGFNIETESESEFSVEVMQNSRSIIPESEADLYVADSGTSMRFLTAMVALGHGRYRIDGSDRMRARPIGDLLNALQQLGADATSENANGFPPVIVNANGLRGGKIIMRGDVSSQFLSAILMVAPFSDTPTRISVDPPLVSAPYVDLTRDVMISWDLGFEQEGNIFRIRSETPKHCRREFVEADATSASYFFAAAAITQGSVRLANPIPDYSRQGDIQFVNVLALAGCNLESEILLSAVHGRPLHGIDVDMNAISDCVPTLAAVACFAEGPTTIRNVAHIRHKESDRIAALATELRKVGAEVDEFPDGLRITPRPLHGAEIETYNDHRIAMSMALIGLKVPGIVIKNPGCVAKTYPGYWDDLEKLRE